MARSVRAGTRPAVLAAVATLVLGPVAGCGVGPGGGTAGASAARTAVSPLASAVPSPDARDTAAALAAAHWRLLPDPPAGPAVGAVLVWDGTAFLRVGGQGTGRIPTATSSWTPGGAAGSDGWTTLPPAPFAVDAERSMSVWTGLGLFVATGSQAAVLDPTGAGRWRVLPPLPFSPSPRATALWTGERIVVVGMVPDAAIQQAGGSGRPTVGVYDPATGGWTRTAPTPAEGHVPLGLAALVHGRDVLVWWLWGNTFATGDGGFVGRAGVDVHRLASDGAWTAIPAGWPQGRTVDLIATGPDSAVLAPGQIWCGACSHPPPVNTNAEWVDLPSLTLTSLPHGPLDDGGGPLLWTGRALAVVNTHAETGPCPQCMKPGDIAFFDPGARRWLSGERMPTPPDGSGVVAWGGHTVVVPDAAGQLFALSPGSPAVVSPSVS